MAITFFSTGSFILNQGDSNSINFQITDQNGNPSNISGATIYFTSKTNPSLPDTSASIQKVLTSFTSASLGMGSFPIVPSDTSGSIPGKYFYSIVQQDSSGNITTLENDAYFLVGSILQAK
jgi:hypothetical protein